MDIFKENEITEDAILRDEYDQYFLKMLNDKPSTDQSAQWLTKNRRNAESIRYIPEAHMTKELVDKIIDRDLSVSFEHFNDFSKTKEMCERAVRINRSNFKHVPDKFVDESMMLYVISASRSYLAGRSSHELFTPAVIDKIASKSPNSLSSLPPGLINESTLALSFKYHGSFPEDVKIPLPLLVSTMNSICKDKEAYPTGGDHESLIKKWEIYSKVLASAAGDMDEVISYLSNTRNSEFNRAMVFHGSGLDDLDVARQYANNKKIADTPVMDMLKQMHGDSISKTAAIDHEINHSFSQ